jgi:recombination protein RecA
MPDLKSEKINAIAEAISKIKERFGEGSIMKLGESKKMQVEAISSGPLSLDIALGVGGFPRGRIIEIFGPEASGKTTLALHAIASAQKQGGTCAFVDAEHALDPDYARRIGVLVETLLISQPDTGEQALDIVETLVRSNALDVVVVDSVAALTPRAEIEGEMGDQHIGLQARLMSQALRKLTAIISKSRTVVIFINQLRHKVGIIFGNPEVTTGGLALKFYSSVRLDVRKTAQIKQGEQIIGSRIKVKVVKNKVAPPFRSAEFDVFYNEGIALIADLFDAAVSLGIIKKTGNTYSFEDKKFGIGRDNAIKTLKLDPKLCLIIRQRISASPPVSGA